MSTSTNEPTVEGFFDNVGGGGSPTAVLKAVDDFVHGEIVDQRVVDYVPFGKTEPETNKDGSIRKQLVVTLQTDLRNWQGVSRIPKVDRDDPNSPEKAPSEDDGKRAVYLPQWSNIQAAVAAAVAKTNGGKPGPLRNGGKLGVKVVNLRDTGKGNPLKEHGAVYEPPVASADFFGGSNTTGANDVTPATAAQPAQQAQQPAPAPAAQPAPVAQQDPWATSAQPTELPAQGSKPPF